MMRVRLISCAVAVVAAALVLVVFGTGAGDDHKGDYKVRAIFNNAFTVIPGEDVKISGVKVGKIQSLDVTPDNKAAVVLDITEPGFKDFRRDATCTIRPQSLIGERYVECTPTQPRADGDREAASLPKIKKGPGKGEYLLPATNTIKPVDIDLVGNIMRLPYRQRLSIIINELGTGLAGNGAALNSAIRQADPALQETDKVLAILADQNRTLAQLAKNGDTVLAPLARDKQKVADFIDKANTTAVASAERRSDIEASLQRFPALLQQLKPTMQQLGDLADQMTPVLTDLGANATDINTFIRQLGPFSQAGIPALKSLGDTSVTGRQALLAAKPITQDLGTFSRNAKPLTENLDSLLTSLRTTGGIERFMDFLYYQAAATNGYDTLGHYLRAVFVLTQCTTYSTTKTPGCSANFQAPVATSASVSRASARTPTVADVNREIANGRSPYLARQDAVAAGLDPKLLTEDASKDDNSSSKDDKKGSRSSSKSSSKASAPISLPSSVFPGSAPATPTTPAPSSGTTTGTTTAETPAAPATSTGTATTPDAGTSSTPATSSTPSSGGAGGGATQTLLDYLLGN